MIELFSCAPLELSPCSLNVLFFIGGELAKGMEKSKGLPSSCPSLSANVKVLVSGGFFGFSSSCLAAGASSLVYINTPFLFSFLGPLLTDSCHGRVSGINKICIRSSSYCRSQATAAYRSRVEHRDGFSSYKLFE